MDIVTLLALLAIEKRVDEHTHEHEGENGSAQLVNFGLADVAECVGMETTFGNSLSMWVQVGARQQLQR